MGDASRPQDPPETTSEPHFYKLGEAARIIGVAPSAVRYWQAEFAAFVRPTRTRAGQHVFSRRDVRALGLIRHLLHVEGQTAREARERLPGLMEAEDAAAEGRVAAEQGLLDLDLAAPPARVAPAGPSPAEIDALAERIALLEREREALRDRANASERHRELMQAKLTDVTQERDNARSRRDAVEQELAAARSRLAEARGCLDETRHALREFLDAVESEEG
jgi:DNA-binding transcriptional MerR regulator